MAIIDLPSGVGNDPNRFKSGNTYRAHPDGTIMRNSSTAGFQYTARLVGLQDIIIQGVTFDDNGVYLENCRNVRFENAAFTDARRGSDNHQAIYGVGNNDLTFANCLWRNNTQCVQLYGGINTTFIDSRMERSNYGIKHGMNGGKNLKIIRVVFDQMRASMGAEIQNDQDAIDGVLIEDCAYINPELYADDSRNKHAMAYSLPMAKAKNVIGRRNYADGLAWILDNNGNRTGERRGSRPGWAGLRIGCEVGGTRPEYYENWMRRMNDPGAITTSTQAQCYNNRVEECLEAWNFASGGNPAGSRLENNGPNVGLPQIGGWSLVGVPAPGTTLPQPPTTDPCESVKAQLADVSQKLGWTNEQLSLANEQLSIARVKLAKASALSGQLEEALK